MHVIDNKTIIITAVVAFIFAAVLVAFTFWPEDKKPIAIAKVNGSSTQQRVDNFFQTKVEGFQESNRIVWDVGDGNIMDEEAIYIQFGFKTPAEKRELRHEYHLAGYKRYISTCYQVESVKADWSLGYCTSKKIPWDEMEA